MATTVVLGAGMAGLASARRLVELGNDVIVVEQGSHVGGRLATIAFGGAVFDHGAQFFTTRGPGFTRFVADAVAAGAVEEWCRGFEVQDGYPRYRGTHGMVSLADWMATGLDVRLDHEVDRIEAGEGCVKFVDGAGISLAEGDDAVVAVPIPQIVGLFDRSGVDVPRGTADSLASTDYFHTLALLVIVEGSPAVAEPGGMQFTDGPFTFIADNQQKGISPLPALTFHADHDYSRDHFPAPDDVLAADLLGLAEPWIGSAAVVEARVTRWRHAGPVAPLPVATEVLDVAGTRIALACDAFAGPKVEGAFNSGVAAAEALA